MALRILPFRQYDENDVINLFSLDEDVPEGGPSVDGVNAAGVLVKVTNGDMTSGVIELEHQGDNRTYLGASFGGSVSPVGRNGYPVNPLKVKAATAAGDRVLGITLRQTLKEDENGEKLLYYPVKKDELQAVLPGETVPVASKGVFTLDAKAFSDSPIVGAELMADAGGKLKTHDGSGVISKPVIGRVLTVGEREAGTYDDQFAGSGSAKFYVIKLDV